MSTTRKALVVGIDNYSSLTPLNGCVNDARSVQSIIATHSDGRPNFSVQLVEGRENSKVVKKSELRDSVQRLFAGDGEEALLFFAGHGHIENTGGYICAGDFRDGSDGVSLTDIMTFANNSHFQHKVIMLDSCHSGVAGDRQYPGSVSELKEGVTILTATTAEQYATEENGTGVFTSLLVDALDGAASNLAGEITPGSIYAHIDQSLGPWSQRPVFKTNVKRFVSLRQIEPPINLNELRRILEFFPVQGHEFKLDPAFEPERPNDPEIQKLLKPEPEKTAIFDILQKYNRHHLLVPVGARHMWHAAMQSKSVKLTRLGEHYRRLVANGLI